jgi:hypothetical protein
MRRDLKYSGEPTTARRRSLLTPDCDHVALYELANLDSSIVLTGDQIDGVIRRGDFEDNLRVGSRKLRQLGQKHHIGSCSRNDEPNAARGAFPQLPCFGQRLLDAFESGGQVLEKSAASGCRGDASGGPGEQLQAQSFLQPPDGVAQSRLRDAKTGSSPSKTFFFGNNCEGGELT